MTRLISFILPLLYSLNVFASGLQASFGSPNLTSLVRPTTRACWDGSIDASGKLLDTGWFGRHLTAYSSPTTATTTLQRPDGNKWYGRAFNGTSQYYAVGFNSSFNVTSANHTLTLVVRSTIDRDILSFAGTGGTAGKVGFTVNNPNNITYNNAGDTKTVTGPLVASLTDGYYHIVQIVCLSRIARVLVDGVPGTPIDITGYGLDAVDGALSLGGSAADYFAGDILYTRLDAEALTEERLAYEKDYLLGIAARSGTADIGWDFSRASAATYEYSDKSVSYSAATNIPRVSGDGGGVLIEGQRTNLVLQSQDFSNAAWDKATGKVTVPAT